MKGMKQVLENLCDIAPVPKNDGHYFEIDAGSTEVKLCIVLDKGELPHIFVKDLLSAFENFVTIDRLMMKKRKLLNPMIDCESAINSRDTKI